MTMTESGIGPEGRFDVAPAPNAKEPWLSGHSTCTTTDMPATTYLVVGASGCQEAHETFTRQVRLVAYGHHPPTTSPRHAPRQLLQLLHDLHSVHTCADLTSLRPRHPDRISKAPPHMATAGATTHRPATQRVRLRSDDRPQRVASAMAVCRHRRIDGDTNVRPLRQTPGLCGVEQAW